MRPLYFFLRLFLPYVLTVFYRKKKTLNAQRKFNAQTIFVSNHPSAFIDPLVAACLQLPVVYFVTRGDIFNKWLHPVTWASHMVPIFRQAQDGADSHEKNKDSFRYLRNVLKRKKSLIMFGEGYTDDIFIRSLKPMKKGPARIAFDTMEETNWAIDLKVQALGINYTHPKYFRSDVLLSMSKCIAVKDYKELYQKSPSKAVTILTRDIEKALKKEITYVEKKELFGFVEHLLILSRKGMNNFHTDRTVKLEDRYTFSKKIAQKVNTEFDSNSALWKNLKEDSDDYFKELNEKKINENWVVTFWRKGNKGIAKNILLLIFGFPFAIIGFIHGLVPYLLIKRFVEKTFRRDVFWSGVKMMLTWVAAAIYNLPFVFLFYHFIYESYLLALVYYLTVPPISWVLAYYWMNRLKDTLKRRKVDNETLEQFVKKRTSLLHQIKTLELY